MARKNYVNYKYDFDTFSDSVQRSKNKYKELKAEVRSRLLNLDSKNSYFCFCSGSVARGDCGINSDLDIFVVADGELSYLQEVQMFSELIQANKKLEYPDFSNDGKFLKAPKFEDIKKALGRRDDDYNNLFTTRMLLLLESKPVFNEELYEKVVKKIIKIYFKEQSGRKGEFVPLYILNDILRYWRTLCLNYEVIRNLDKPWRKKNINLKFSRMLTVYSAVIPVVLKQVKTQTDWYKLVKTEPIDRIALSLQKINDDNLRGRFRDFVECYNYFLSLKDEKDIESVLSERGAKEVIKRKSRDFSNFIYDLLSSEYADKRLKKCLVI